MSDTQSRTSSQIITETRRALIGSERPAFAAQGNPLLLFATPAVSAEADEDITVSVLLRHRSPLPEATSGTRLTREELAERHGAAPASVQHLRDFAEAYALRMEPGPGDRTFHLSGKRSSLENAFGCTLYRHTMPDGSQLRLRTGAVMLPSGLLPHVAAVLGLDNRPQAQPHFRVAQPRASNTSYTPPQVAALYSFPAGASAKGQTIGLIELGGGSKPADITAYFKSLGIAAPTTTAVAVDGGKNAPGNPNGADGEVMLDIEVAGGAAPGVALAVYFAPNTDQGFIDAVTTAVHDTKHKPAVLSISWGGPEDTWTAQALTAMDQACQAAAALGVTITVACGDNGSTDGESGKANHVDFPASSPHVLACGGTKLTGTASGSGAKITSEVVWNELASNEGATGGGVSVKFPKPAWQSAVNVPKPTAATGGRGLPDVAGDADPATGYTIRVDGQTAVIGGTSAVAPLWAALIALANAVNGRSAGFVNPTLYQATGAFRDITSGNNGGFKAGPGWDACTGLGSPIGTAVVEALAPATAHRGER